MDAMILGLLALITVILALTLEVVATNAAHRPVSEALLRLTVRVALLLAFLAAAYAIVITLFPT